MRHITFRFNGSNDHGGGVTRYHFNDGVFFVSIDLNQAGDVIASTLRQDCDAFRQLWNAAISQQALPRPATAPLFAHLDA